MKLGKIFVLTGAFLVMTNSANAKLPGYTEGAEIMRPKIENGQIDSMSGIIYSQIKGLRPLTMKSTAALITGLFS